MRAMHGCAQRSVTATKGKMPPLPGCFGSRRRRQSAALGRRPLPESPLAGLQIAEGRAAACVSDAATVQRWAKDWKHMDQDDRGCMPAPGQQHSSSTTAMVGSSSGSTAHLRCVQPASEVDRLATAAQRAAQLPP